MNAFKKLVIENFQSHQRTEIDFSMGLNVFVGPSDSGKSAILRALRWVLFNTPRGTEFIRTGARECRVRLELSDGTEIVRIRSASVNRYILRKPDGTEQVFEGFGNAVPEEITAVHGIRPVRFDQKELLLHFGGQLESPFLLFESGQNKAKTIGRIIGAHLIDQALKKAAAEHRFKSQEIRRLEEDQKEIEEKLKPYENLDKLEEAVKRTEEAMRSAREKRKRLERLKRLAAELFLVRGEKRETVERIRQFGRISETEESVRALERKADQHRRLSRLSEKRREVAGGKAECLHLIRQSEHLPLASELVRSLESKREQLTRLAQNHLRLQEVRRTREKIGAAVKELETVPHALGRVQRLERLAPRLQSLKKLHAEQSILNREKERSHVVLQKFSRVRQGLVLLPVLESKSRQLSRFRGLSENLSDVRRRMAIGREFVGEKEREAAGLMKEWADALRRMGKCPTCKTPIDSSVFDHIMEEFGGGLARAAAGRENQGDQGAAGEGQK